MFILMKCKYYLMMNKRAYVFLNVWIVTFMFPQIIIFLLKKFYVRILPIVFVFHFKVKGALWVIIYIIFILYFAIKATHVQLFINKLWDAVANTVNMIHIIDHQNFLRWGTQHDLGLGVSVFIYFYTWLWNSSLEI